MTILWESTQWSCNRCGTTMKYRDPKLVMADADGSGNLEKLDVHLCLDCRDEIIDFANGKEVVIAGYPTMKQHIKKTDRNPSLDRIDKVIREISKKKHPFYGNQHKKVVRK